MGNSIGKKISKFRLLRGLTQKQLAKRIGVTQACVSYIESGNRGVAYPTLKRMAKVLDVRVGELWSLDEDDEPADLLAQEEGGV